MSEEGEYEEQNLDEFLKNVSNILIKKEDDRKDKIIQTINGKNLYKNNIGDWGLGIGDWGLGIGDWAQSQSPIPNPQSPIPNPHSNFKLN